MTETLVFDFVQHRVAVRDQQGNVHELDHTLELTATVPVVPDPVK